MRSRAVHAIGVFLLVCAATPQARADMGTPLVWAEAGHLFFGNAIIGLLEGLCIAVLFKTGKVAAVLWMVVANYASMLLGVFLFNRCSPSPLGDMFGHSAPLSLTLQNALTYHVVALALLMAVTAVVEWPFCFAILRRHPRRLLRSTGACLLAQFVSYALLCSCYIPISSMSVITNTELTAPSVFAKTPDAWICYVSPVDGDVWRIHPDGSGRTHVCAAGIANPYIRLGLQRSEDGSAWDLWSRSWRWGSGGEGLRVPIFTRAPALPDDDYDDPDATAYFPAPAEPTDLTPSSARTWLVEARGDWPDEGLWAENQRTGERLRLAMATPLLRWMSSSPVVLPGDQVVYQVGDQIVLLDLNTRKLGLITYGRGPVVIGDDLTPTSMPTTASQPPTRTP